MQIFSNSKKICTVVIFYIITLFFHASLYPEFLVEQESKKIKEAVPGALKKQKLASEQIRQTVGVDAIIWRTFFKGKYYLAIKELQDFLESTDNKIESGKAQLFIGRSLFELGQYSKAIIYFCQENVKEYFPEEADFWIELAMINVK